MRPLLYPGFADPVRDSQAVFRAVLDAVSRPGRIHAVSAPDAPPPPLDRATAAALLTLVDGDIPLWLDPAAAEARDWLAFHAGAQFAAADAARFAVALRPLDLGRLSSGTDEEPESSATLLLQVEALGEGTAYRLDGPGLATPAELCVRGLADDFPAVWRANGRLFPRGVDVILCAGDQLAALPRTVRMEAA